MNKNSVKKDLELIPLEQMGDMYDVSLLEERFCQMVALRGITNLTECYRSAFPSASGYTDHQILGHCNKLLSNKPLCRRIEELKEQNLNASKVVKAFKVSALKRVVDEALEMEDEKGRKDFRAVIAAIAELNKMQGDHMAPQKPDFTEGGVSDEDEENIREVINQYEKEY